MRMTPAVLLLATVMLLAFGQSPAGAAVAVHNRSGEWYAYHADWAHSGFDQDMPRFTGGLHVVKRLRLDGAVYASPLVVHGMTIVATENNSIYAFDSRNRQVWKRHLHAPSPQSQRPCGDIDPLGITSTPYFAAKTGLLYVAAEYSGNPPKHYLVALNPKTGSVRFTRNIDLAGADSRVMQLRGALNFAGGRVWASFGALAGDCGNYVGRVVGVSMSGSGKLVKFQPSTNRQGGIWNPAGPTVDSQGNLFAVSANGSTFPGDKYDHTNSVNKFSPSGKLLDSFAPSNWAQNNQADVGLGSQGPAFVGKWVVLGGKSGPVYVLRRSHLGGIGGQVNVRNICKSFGGAAVRTAVVYLPCLDGVRALRIGPHGGMRVDWHAASNITGSPVVGGNQVWTLDSGGGRLYALGLSNGRTNGSVSVGRTNRFATPALSGRRILVPTLTGLTVVGY